MDTSTTRHEHGHDAGATLRTMAGAQATEAAADDGFTVPTPRDDDDLEPTIVRGRE